MDKYIVYIIDDVELGDHECSNCGDVGNYVPFVNEYGEWIECDCGALFLREGDVPGREHPDYWELKRCD